MNNDLRTISNYIIHVVVRRKDKNKRNIKIKRKNNSLYL